MEIHKDKNSSTKVMALQSLSKESEWKFDTSKIKNYLSCEVHLCPPATTFVSPLMLHQSDNLVLNQNLRQDCQEAPPCMCAAVVMVTNILDTNVVSFPNSNDNR